MPHRFGHDARGVGPFGLRKLQLGHSSNDNAALPAVTLRDRRVGEVEKVESVAHFHIAAASALSNAASSAAPCAWIAANRAFAAAS